MWARRRSCGDADIAGLFFMLKFDGIGQDWLLQNQERCAVSQRSLVVSKESSQSKEVFISVCCESFPTVQVRASAATARAWRASAGILDQMMCYCAAAASLVFAFWYLGTLEADFSATAAFEGDLGSMSLHSVTEAVGEDELCELDSKAAAAIDCDSALEERHFVLEAVEMVRHSEPDGSAASAMDGDLFLVEQISVLDNDWEVGHNAASSLTVGTGVQASGRVDVPWRRFAACSSSFARSTNALRSQCFKIDSF